MSWKDKLKEYGPGSLLFLSSDGASVNFIVVADPVQLKGTYKKNPQERIGCPVVTEEGFVLFVCGKRVFRKLTALEDKFSDHIINVTRHGVEGDMETTYEVTAIPDSAKVASLKKISAKLKIKDAIAEAVAEAADVMSN